MAKKETKKDSKKDGKQAKGDGGKKKKGQGGGPKQEKKKAPVEIIAAPDDYIPRLLTQYRETAVPNLMKEFGYDNVMQVPRMQKVILNVGIGTAHQDQRLLDSVLEELTTISGQKPVVTRAKKSISNFKLREGMQVGVRVTLRRYHMWEFLDRLFNLTMPRVRDFRGLPTKSFDGRGNYSIGIKEQIVFPEIDYDKVEKIHGMDITIVTSAQNDEEGMALLRELGCPFRKPQPQQAEAATA